MAECRVVYKQRVKRKWVKKKYPSWEDSKFSFAVLHGKSIVRSDFTVKIWEKDLFTYQYI